MLIRREGPADVEAIRQVLTSAFASDDPQTVPVEVGLVDGLRASDAWLPQLSLVALVEERVVGHVICTRADVDGIAALALGPVGVPVEHQGAGIGSALMHAVLGAADALDERVVVLLGHVEYYPRFGFRPASEYGIAPPVKEWGAHFQARPLSCYDGSIRGQFNYAQPFNEL